jgi:hypothetical protein
MSNKRDAIRSSMSKILDRNLKQDSSSSDDEVKLIDYETSNDLTLLNADRLNNDIKILDKKNVENLIKKAQRLYLFAKHKLYRDLNYQNLEEFAQQEHNIHRAQLHKYVSIFEKLENQLLDFFLHKKDNQNVQSTIHFEELSIEKLYIIAKLEEEQKIDIWFNKIIGEKISVSELKKELVSNNLLPETPKLKSKFILRREIKDFISKMPKELNFEEQKELVDFIHHLRKAIEIDKV